MAGDWFVLAEKRGKAFGFADEIKSEWEDARKAEENAAKANKAKKQKEFDKFKQEGVSASEAGERTWKKFEGSLKEWETAIAELEKAIADEKTKLEKKLKEVEAHLKEIDDANKQISAYNEGLIGGALDPRKKDFLPRDSVPAAGLQGALAGVDGTVKILEKERAGLKKLDNSLIDKIRELRETKGRLSKAKFGSK